MAAIAQALDAAWAKYDGRAKRLLSRNFFKEVRLQSDFDVKPIALRKVERRIPQGMVPDCEACTDPCCHGRENLVSLRIRDIARILDAGRPELIQRKKPRFTPQELEDRPQLRELAASTLFQRLPVLRQVGPHHQCAALDENGRCSLYPNWPLSCERFPYTLTLERTLVWGARCPSSKQHPKYAARAKALSQAAVDTYNARIQDAVLLAHAQKDLHALGLGAYLIQPGEDPFEAADPLPILP